MVNNLKHLAPVLGFSGYQPLIQHYLYQGLQSDLERLDHSTVLSVADKLVDISTGVSTQRVTNTVA